MCIRIDKRSGKLIFDYKRLLWFIGAVAATITAMSVIRLQCNNGIAYAQETFVRSEAADVFDSLHQPFEARLCAMRDSISQTKNDVAVLIEMVKLSNSDKPNLYRDAKRAVVNAGRFPEEN